MRGASIGRAGVSRRWAVALGLALALVAVAVFALWQLRRDTVAGQARELAVLSLALADEIERTLQGVQQGLQALRAELREGRLAGATDIAAARADGADAPRETIESTLRARVELLPRVRQLWLLDRDGAVLASSAAAPPPELASFSPPPGGLADDSAALSRDWVDAGSGETRVAVALAAAGGKQQGWVVAALPADTLRGAFVVAQPANDARMAVFRDDGVRLAGQLVANPKRNEAAMAQRLSAERTAELRQLSDGSERLVDVRSLPRYGLKVVLTRDLSAVLAAWEELARLAAAGVAVLLAIVALAARRVQRADRRRAEAQATLQTQLARSSKLQALGTLAGGVAHDFNNVLAAALGYAEMARDAAPAGSDQARQLDHVLAATLRGQALVERILAFSRGGARRNLVFEIEPLIDEVLTLLAASLRPGLVLERRLQASGARLRGDPTQAFEAVMNLCTNAMQATAGAGRLEVSLVREHVALPRVLSHDPLPAGDWLALSVTDEGSGISPEVMERLFEPFFSTRGPQAGSGLGLAVVHGVVADFGGAIDVQSTPGRGSRFTLYLPESHDALAASASAAPGVPGGQGQTVMVVDDDPGLVALAEEMLAGLGYEAVGYADPGSALQSLRDDTARFDAVVTDEVMPGLSGTLLAAEVRRLAPQLPVLLVSGWGGAQLGDRAAAAGVTRVLSKPLQRAELAHALADLFA